MKISKLSAALTGLLMGVACNLTLADEHCDHQDIIDLGAGAYGEGTLCTTNHGLRAKIKVKNLVPGNAYTTWWVYFDDPSLCSHGGPGICGDSDFAPSDAGGGTPLAVFGRLGSAVAPRSGMVRMNSDWGGMQPSHGAEIWLLTLSHGGANYGDGRHLARQLLTPEDPLAGMPHLGNDVDGPGFIPTAITVHIVE